MKYRTVMRLVAWVAVIVVAVVVYRWYDGYKSPWQVPVAPAVADYLPPMSNCTKDCEQ